MKRTLLAVLFLFGAIARADIYSVAVDASSSNIPVSFSASSASRVLQNVQNVRGILINNNTGLAVAVNCSYRGSFVPQDNDVHNIYVPPQGATAIDQAYLAGTCFIRSRGGVISSGTLELMLVGG